MTTFTCQKGHRHALQFKGDDVSKPCPTCGDKVYRYRDGVDTETGVEAQPETPSKVGKEPFSLKRKTIYITVAGVIVLFAARIYLEQYNSEAKPVQPAQAITAPEQQVVPQGSPQPAPAAIPGATISGMQTEVSETGVVKATFRLTNNGAMTRYPDLMVSWQGTGGPEQRIGSDDYAHPPLPFTSADVALELARPSGATGIDVRLAY